MKKAIAILSIILLISFKTNQEKTLNFSFSVEETQIILKGLSKLSYEESAVIINKIQVSAQKQLTDTTKKK